MERFNIYFRSFVAVLFFVFALYCFWAYMTVQPLNSAVWIGAMLGGFNAAYDEGRKLGWNK